MMIGGEFPIAVTDILNVENRHAVSPDVYIYSSGRAALYQILKYLKVELGVNSILLPDYLCSSLLVPINKLKLDFQFYPIDEVLELKPAKFHELYKTGTAVLLINYFGLKDLSPQVDCIHSVDEHAIIIEDDVQAYYEFKKELDGVDFKFTSLRKTFAVPDGGLVKTRHLLPKIDAPNSFGQYKAAAAVLKHMSKGNFHDQIYLELFEKGELLIDSELEHSISAIGEKLYSIIDEEQIKVSRINNAKYLIDSLQQIGITPILPLTDNHVPLFVPIYLPNRNAVRKEMFANEVFCPVHWPLEGLDVRMGRQMADMELSLIIDQRYGRKEMDKIVSLFA